jgi:RNA polymerase sigma-54 factor
MSQQLVMTPQLQQAIKLLQLSHLEIADVLREEIEQNPVLEEQGPHEGADELEPEPGGGEHQTFDSAQSYEGEAELHSEPEAPPSLVDSAMGDAADLDYQAGMLDTDLPQSAEAPLDATPIPDDAQTSCDVDWENYIDAHSYALPGSGHSASDAFAGAFEAALTKPTSLAEHLRWQVRMSQMTADEQAIAFLLIEEINADGYLNEGATLLIEDELDCSAADVEHVLHILQDFDPKGVGARNLAECLSLQARHLAAEHPVVHAIIEQFLPLVERRDFGAIARRLKVSPAAVSQAIATIKHLEPRPGAAFCESEPQYITPDIYVHKVGPLPSDYVVMLNEEGLPRLRISEYYRDALGKQTQSEAKQYIQEKYRSAAWLIRSIHMRQRTIYRVMQSILHFQIDFFEQGVQALKPLILRDVAQDVDMHESTISRVTANKYVHTPQGIYELKYFFNSSIRGTDGDSVASESVRNHIERLIASEDCKAPLSDQRIVQILKVQDIDIARRTVAKYREMLKIPSSSRRRRVI